MIVCVHGRFLKSILVIGLKHLMDYLSGNPRGHPHQIKCLEQQSSVSLSPHLLTLFIRSLLTLQSLSQIDGENVETNPCGLQSADFGPSDAMTWRTYPQSYMWRWSADGCKSRRWFNNCLFQALPSACQIRVCWWITLWSLSLVRIRSCRVIV